MVRSRAYTETAMRRQPITVRLNGEGFESVAGKRRLRAAEALGWKKIRARIGKFSDDELREIELDENTVRLDPTFHVR